MIAVVDYGMGNLRSVQKALEAVGAKACVTRSAEDLRRAKAVVLPGVGAFGEAVRRLKSEHLWDILLEILAGDKPFLGICLGLQLLFEDSEETPGVKGLGYLKGSVVRFKFNRQTKFKVPHTGWNGIDFAISMKNPCLKGISEGEYFYFVHSFYSEPDDMRDVATTTEYGSVRFCSSIARNHVFACQFHPEKSGSQGLRVLSNFLHQAKQC